MRFLLACCFAVVMYGQDPNGSDPQRQIISVEQPLIDLARKWIADPRPVYRAWAADLIRRHELSYFGRELIQALGDVSQITTQSGSESDEDRMRFAILDALIQLHGQLPKSVGQALFSRYPAQTLILLYQDRAPDVRAGAYFIDNCKSDECWLVVAQCLARQRGGPIELLRRLKIKAEVKVFDPNRGEGMSLGSAGGVHGGLCASAGVVGWPASYTYHLAIGSDFSTGYTLLMVGRYPVYYRREAVECSETHVHGNRNEYILELLADRLGTKRESLGVVTHPSVQLQWTTAERYRSDLQAFVAAHQLHYAELVSLLLRHRDLTPEESEHCNLNLEIEVIDRRLDRSQSIPGVGVGDHPR